MSEGNRGGIVRPPRPRLRGTDRNPTVGSLMAREDRSDWVAVRVPMFTKVAHVRYDPIWVGTLKHDPGVEYMRPPEIAAEVERAIANFEQVPMQQMTGKSEVQKGVIEELAAQADFERRRLQVAALIN